MISAARQRILTLTLLAAVTLGGALMASGCLDAGTGGGKETVAGSGTITYVDLEGGFYGIVTGDGTRYLPLNLPEEFRNDGLQVRFEGTIEEDVATIQQWGTPLTLTAIEADGESWKAVHGN